MISIKVMNIWQCNPDAEDTFEQELKRLVDMSVTESGCISFEIYQPKARQGEYVVIEEWVDDPSLEQHQQSAHYKYFTRIAPVLQSQPPQCRQLARLI